MTHFISVHKDGNIMNIETYKKFIKELAENNVDRIFLNSDEEKACAVLVQLINLSNNKLCIFAGSLTNKKVGDSEEYIKAITGFIERGGSVEILLNDYNEITAMSSNIFKRLAYYAQEGKPIKIKKTKVKPYRTGDSDKNGIHFTVGDSKSYRVETNTKERTAGGNFNSSAVAEVYESFFKKIFNRSDSIDIDLSIFLK